MKPLFADAFFFLALGSRDDAAHGLAVSLFKDLKAPMVTTAWILTETDCISFVVMEENQILEALTGDHHFEQAGFRILFK